jgi:hypothetical protein
MVYLICVVSVVAPSFSPARAALTGGATSTITSGALHREVYNLHTNISSFLLGVTAIQTVGEGARLAGGRSGETRGIGRRNGGVLRRVAAVS